MRSLQRVDQAWDGSALHRVPRHPLRHLDPLGVGRRAGDAGPGLDHRRRGDLRRDPALGAADAAGRRFPADRRGQPGPAGLGAGSSSSSRGWSSISGATAGSRRRTGSRSISSRSSPRRSRASTGFFSRPTSRPAGRCRCWFAMIPAPEQQPAADLTSPRSHLGEQPDPGRAGPRLVSARSYGRWPVAARQGRHPAAPARGSFRHVGFHERSLRRAGRRRVRRRWVGRRGERSACGRGCGREGWLGHSWIRWTLSLHRNDPRICRCRSRSISPSGTRLLQMPIHLAATPAPLDRWSGRRDGRAACRTRRSGR